MTHREQMRNFLKEKLRAAGQPQGVYIPRDQIEAVGPDPEAALAMFLWLKDEHYWYGECHWEEDGKGMVFRGAWLTAAW